MRNNNDIKNELGITQMAEKLMSNYPGFKDHLVKIMGVEAVSNDALLAQLDELENKDQSELSTMETSLCNFVKKEFEKDAQIEDLMALVGTITIEETVRIMRSEGMLPSKIYVLLGDDEDTGLDENELKAALEEAIGANPSFLKPIASEYLNAVGDMFEDDEQTRLMKTIETVETAKILLEMLTLAPELKPEFERLNRKYPNPFCEKGCKWDVILAELIAYDINTGTQVVKRQKEFVTFEQWKVIHFTRKACTTTLSDSEVGRLKRPLGKTTFYSVVEKLVSQNAGFEDLTKATISSGPLVWILDRRLPLEVERAAIETQTEFVLKEINAYFALVKYFQSNPSAMPLYRQLFGEDKKIQITFQQRLNILMGRLS